MKELPFVSAICIAGKSRWHDDHFLQQAIHWFRVQTYPKDRRELLIVTDAEWETATPGDSAQENIHLVHVAKQSLGGLRNAGLEAMQGDYAIQWDVDDAHHPSRISAQVSFAIDHPGLPVLLQRQLCYDWPTDTACVRDLVTTPIHGSILHPRTDARYPLTPKEEDTAFLANWGNLVIVDNDPCLYTRFSHGRNTWNRRHVLRFYAADWASGGWFLSDEHRGHLKSVLSLYDLKADLP